jgi:phospholipid/cholesterol/gamma-HCH transport system ATP-binding protein
VQAPHRKDGVIEIHNLKKSFGGQAVLKGVNLRVPRGTTVVVIGGSGAGKTVLLRHINGLMKPDAGEVIVDGVDITRLSEPEMNAFRLRLGMVFQGSALFDSLNVGENVAFALREHTKYSEEKIEAIVKEKLLLMGLRDIENMMPAELSGGMKKRVAVARAIVLEPEIMLYDEPTAGMDPRTADSINNLIIRLQETLHATALAVTHDMASAFKIADRIYMLKGGNFIAEGTPQEIRESTNPDVRKFINGQALEEEK